MRVYEDFIDDIEQDDLRQDDMNENIKHDYRFVIELKDETFYEHEYNELVRRLDMVMRRQPEIVDYGVMTNVTQFTFKYGFDSSFKNMSSAYSFIQSISTCIDTSCQNLKEPCMFLYDYDDEMAFSSTGIHPRTLIYFNAAQNLREHVKTAVQTAYTWIWQALRQLTGRSTWKCQEFVLKRTNALKFMTETLAETFHIPSVRQVDTFSVRQIEGLPIDISAMMKMDMPDEVKWHLFTVSGNSVDTIFNGYAWTKAITNEYIREITDQLWLRKPQVYSQMIFIQGNGGTPDSRKYLFCCYAGMITPRNDFPRIVYITVETMWLSKVKPLPAQNDFFRVLNVLLSGNLSKDVMKDVQYAISNSSKKVNEDFLDNISGDDLTVTNPVNDESHQRLGCSMLFEINPYEQNFTYKIHRRADIEKRLERYMRTLPDIQEYDIYYTGNPFYEKHIEQDLRLMFVADDTINALDGFMICVTFDGQFKTIRRSLEFTVNMMDNIKRNRVSGWYIDSTFQKWKHLRNDYVTAFIKPEDFNYMNSVTQQWCIDDMTELLTVLTGDITKVLDFVMGMTNNASSPLIKFAFDNVDRLTPGKHQKASTVYMGQFLSKYMGSDEEYFRQMNKFTFTKDNLCSFISDTRTKLYLGKYAWPDRFSLKEIMDMAIWSDFNLCRDNQDTKTLSRAKSNMKVLASDFRMKIQGNDSFVCYLCVLSSYHEENDTPFFPLLAVQQKVSGSKGIKAAVKGISKAIQKLSGQSLGFEEALQKTMEALY